MTSACIVAALAVVLYSLWVRRDTWWSRWEAAATLTIALEGMALLLMSPWAATEFGPLLFRAVRLWNVPHLLGVICLIVALTASSYHVMVRLADPRQTRALLRRHLVIPMWTGVAAMVLVFVISDEEHHTNLPAAPVTDAWLALYWLLVCGLVIYLTGYVARLTLILRADPRARSTVRLYLVSAAFGVGACLSLLVGAWTGIDTTAPIWLCACLAVGVYAYGSARSWQAKAAWFVPVPQERQGSDPPRG